jgi:hypothetical protein
MMALRPQYNNTTLPCRDVPAAGCGKQFGTREEVSMKTYTVQLFYSGYCTREVRAKSEGDAIKKARLQLNIDTDSEAQREILNSLESWEEADQVLC